MNDVVGDRSGNHPLSHTRETRSGSVINGRHDPNRSFENLHSWLDVSDYWWLQPDQSRFDENNISVWTRLMANSVPDAPVLLLPALMAENLGFAAEKVSRGIGLGLFSEMTKKHTKRNGKRRTFDETVAAYDKKYGRGDPRFAKNQGTRVADDYLSYQFGAVPFIADAIKMAQFAQSAEKRRKRIERSFNSPRGDTTKWSHGTGEYQDEWVDFDKILFSEVVLRCDVKVTNSVKRWFYASWKPKPSRLLPRADNDWVNAIMGLDARGLTLSAWELLPFSWMIDYFVNIGDFLAATLNTLNWDVTGGTCMEQVTRQEHGPTHAVSAWGYTTSLSAGSTERIRHYRYVEFPQPGLTWARQYLTGSQLSILGALTVAKAW